MKTKNCKTCDFFKTVYRGYGCRLSYSLAYPLYYCTLSGQMAERENSCDNWRKRIKQFDISPQRFAEAEEDIKTLIDLLSKFS